MFEDGFHGMFHDFSIDQSIMKHSSFKLHNFAGDSPACHVALSENGAPPNPLKCHFFCYHVPYQNRFKITI